MTAGQVLCQFFGFLIQTLPIAALFFVPFQDDDLKLPRKNLIIIFCGTTILASAGYALLSWYLFLPSGEHNTLLRIASNIYMTVCVMICAVAFSLTVRSALSKKITILVLLIHYAAALFTLGSIIIGEFTGNLQPDLDILIVYSKYEIIVYSALMAVTFPLVYMFLKKEIRFALSFMESSTLRHGCIYVLLALILFAVSVFSLNSFAFYYGFSGMAVLLFLISFMLTDCILYFTFFSEMRMSIQLRQREEQLRIFDEQYRQITSGIEEARRIRHDMRHHFNIISTMNHHGEQKALETYLESYESSIRELEDFSLCGYPAFDNILQYYINIAKRQDITVKSEIPPLLNNLEFDIIDLTVLLGNLLENAIEACCQLPTGNPPRFIRIWIKQTEAVFLLEVENTCEETNSDTSDFTDGSRFTSTKHTRRHGHGLRSIKYVAEKYGGSAEFKKANGVFTARIVMNIP